jgi:hypothetical protein
MEIQEKEQQETKKGKNPFFIFIVFILLISILFSVYYFFLKGSSFEERFSFSEKNPTGEIYLTLSPKGEEKPNIYKLDVESMELEEYFKDSPYKNYMAKFSSDREKMVFVREYEDGKSQILLLDVNSNKILEVTEKLDYQPNNPVFSQDDSSIVFWIYESNESASNYGATPDSHSIYVVSLDDFEKEKVANGVFPIFFPGNESLLYLGNKGLYYLAFDNLEAEVFVDISDLMEELGNFADDPEQGFWGWFSIRFNYLAEKDLIVLTNSMNSRVYFAELTEMESGLRYYHWYEDFEFNAPHWPNISPDGNFFVMQDFDFGVTDWSQLSILDIAKPNVIKRISLADFRVDSIWVTDWID